MEVDHTTNQNGNKKEKKKKERDQRTRVGAAVETWFVGKKKETFVRVGKRGTSIGKG